MITDEQRQSDLYDEYLADLEPAATECGVCNGEGWVSDDYDETTCHACDGTGAADFDEEADHGCREDNYWYGRE